MLIIPNVKTIVVEAGSKYSWGSIASNQDCLITVDNFGKSGSKDEVLNYMNFNYEQIKQRIKELL